MSTYAFNIHYIYKAAVKAITITSNDDEMPVYQAALRLIELHQAGAENSLAMPSADAGPEEIMQLAESHGIHDIHVTRRQAGQAEDGTRPTNGLSWRDKPRKARGQPQ